MGLSFELCIFAPEPLLAGFLRFFCLELLFPDVGSEFTTDCVLFALLGLGFGDVAFVCAAAVGAEFPLVEAVLFFLFLFLLLLFFL